MLYNNLSGYLKTKYGKRVGKICIDGGFSCPNRDGTCGRGGCIFCGERGAGEHIDPTVSIREQVLCGLEKAQGQAVIVMDADLQDPPEVALEMVEKWKEGYDVVHGRRRKRSGETIFKKASAFLYYRFMRKITKMDMPKDVGDFKLYDRKVVDAILSMGEHDRLLRAQATWVGFKQTFVEFDRPERIAGETHYTLKKMIKLAEAGIFPNTDYTLTFPIKLGVLLGFLSVICYIVFIILSCCNVDFGGLTAWLFPMITTMTAILLVCQGFANMHTNMIYKEVQNRPKYILSEKINFNE